jgi:hypothetical protein
MTNKVPAVKKLTDEAIEDNTPAFLREPTVTSRKNYVVLQTATIKGTRLNLDSMESYSTSGDLGLTIAKASGTLKLEFNSREERDELLAKLDAYCL